jgi:hypothetical protein
MTAQLGGTITPAVGPALTRVGYGAMRLAGRHRRLSTWPDGRHPVTGRAHRRLRPAAHGVRGARRRTVRAA